MKKSGFTLAELMITLGIIAVAAVVAAPALSNMMPQKDKIKVVKYAVVIDDATNELLADESLYHSTRYTGIVVDEYGNSSISENFNSGQVGAYSCIGLACTQAPSDFQGDPRYTGANKYQTLLSDKLLRDGKYVDGSVWTFETNYNPGNSAAGITPDISVKILIDTDGDKHGKNCHFPFSSFDNSGCHQPDTFVFTVDKNGNVSGGDPLTRAYLANPLNMHDKKKDQDAASNELKNMVPKPTKG